MGALSTGVATNAAIGAVGLEVAADAVALAEAGRAAVAVVATETVAVDLAGRAAAIAEGTGPLAALGVGVARLSGGIADRCLAPCDRSHNQSDDRRSKSA
jgi:hypothetical protein